MFVRTIPFPFRLLVLVAALVVGLLVTLCTSRKWPNVPAMSSLWVLQWTRARALCAGASLPLPGVNMGAWSVILHATTAP